MSSVKVAFKILEGDKPPVGYQYMDCHMVFDVKMESNFRHKARLVAGGHMTETSNVPTYASVISQETVRISLTYAVLNDLEVKGSDIKNDYLTALCEEKIYTWLGPEFGPDEGKSAIITCTVWITVGWRFIWTPPSGLHEKPGICTMSGRSGFMDENGTTTQRWALEILVRFVLRRRLSLHKT